MSATRADIFPVGPPVPRDRQIGRDGDIDRLAAILRGGDHAVLSDRRRAGKSTVALAALDQMVEVDKVTVVAVDLTARISGTTELAKAIARQVATQRSQSASRRLQGSQLALTLWNRVKQADVPGVTDQEEARALKALLTLLESKDNGVAEVAAALNAADQLARERGARAVVFFDEAQQLGVWPDGLELQQELRVRLRAPERQSTFLFAGSAQSMMETLFAADGLLEWDGQQFELSPVTDEPWREGLRRAFRELGTDITLRATEAILDGADGRPMRMMLIANRAHLLATLVEADTIDHELAAQAVREAQRDRLWSEGE